MSRYPLLLLAILLILPPPANGFMTATTTNKAVPAKAADRPGIKTVPGKLQLPERIQVTGQEPLSLVLTRLHVTIRHGIAVCRLIQVFQNNTNEVLEGVYRLPLPPGAEVNGFAVWDEGIKLVGEIMPRPQAQKVYDIEKARIEEAIREEKRLRDPGMLTRDLTHACTIRVFPILPRAMKQIEVDYSLVLPVEEGRMSYGFPLGLARTFANVGRTVIEVDLADPLGVDGGANIGKASASSDTTLRWVVDMTGRPAADFELRWRPTSEKVGVSIVTHRPVGEAGYFVLRVQPSKAYLAQILDEDPMDWLVMVDTSGSMIASKRVLARRAARELLGAARGKDRIRLIGLGARTEELSGGWVAPSSAAVDAAIAKLGKVDRFGSSGAKDLLEAVLSKLPTDRRVRVLLISDGIFTDDADALTGVITKSLPARARLDMVGLGYDDDPESLSALASAGRGAAVIAGKIPRGMQANVLGAWVGGGRWQQVPQGRYGEFTLPGGPLFTEPFLWVDRTPLRDLKFELKGASDVKVSQVYADWQLGLRPGQAALVFGRFSGTGAASGVLSGTLGSDTWTETVRFELPDAEPKNRMVAAFWARRHVRAMEEAGGLTQAQKDEIIALSKRHRFVTSLTAFLAVTDEMRMRHGLGDAPADDIETFYEFSEGVPEPETILLVILVLLVLGMAARRRQAEALRVV